MISPADLPERLVGTERIARHLVVSIGTPLEEVEDRLIEETLRYTKGDKTLAAKLLGIATRTIYRRMRAEPESEGTGPAGDASPQDSSPPAGELPSQTG
jgi:two-component system response regulator HydG